MGMCSIYQEVKEEDFKKCLTKFISKIVKNMAEITNSKKNVKKNKCIFTPSNIKFNYWI